MLAYGEKSLEIPKFSGNGEDLSVLHRLHYPPGKEPMVLTDKGEGLGPKDTLGILEKREMP
jgi:hypothetical protein